MQKITFIITLLIFSTITIGQNTSTWQIEHKPKSFNTLEKVQTVENPKTGNLFTFIRERNFETLYITNSAGKAISNFEWSTYDFDRVNLEGVIFGDQEMTIISKLNKNVYIYTINLQSGKMNKRQLSFKSKKERHIETVSFDDKIYIINSVKKEAVFRVYTLTQKGGKLIHDFPFNESEYMSLSTLTKNLKRDKMTIKSGLPVDITSTKFPIKIYHVDELFSLCIEHKHKTYTFQLDLENYSSNFYVNRASQSKTELSSFVTFNSFLFGDELLQTISKIDGIDVFIKDLKTDKIKRTLKIRRDQEIAFKNSIILQEKGEKNKRVLEKTNQFIRKATASGGSLSISAFRTNGNIQMNLGGVQNIQSASPGAMMFGALGAGMAMSIGNVSVYFNPSYMMYYNYSNLKVTTIKCLFDTDYNSIDGEIQENVFDKIKKDEKEIKRIEGKSICITPNSVISGYYDYKNKLYKFKSYAK